MVGRQHPGRDPLAPSLSSLTSTSAPTLASRRADCPVEGDLIETRTIQPDLLALHLGAGREATIYAPTNVMRQIRDRLSTSLGDNGTSRVAGIYQGAVVVVDDNGQHTHNLDDLTELASCAECVDQPATTTDDAGRPRCLTHA